MNFYDRAAQKYDAAMMSSDEEGRKRLFKKMQNMLGFTVYAARRVEETTDDPRLAEKASNMAINSEDLFIESLIREVSE